MSWIEMVGHAGSLLSSITFMPQVYKVWQTKRTQDLSLSMMLIVFSSTLVWIIYGVGLVLWPVLCILALGMNSELVTSQGKPEEIAS